MSIALHTVHSRLYQDTQLASGFRDEFLAMVSHELRTPLTPLQLQLQTLERQVPALARDEAAAECLAARLATLKRQGDRLARLVNELLDIPLLMHEPQELTLERVDLDEVARGVLTELTEIGAVARSRCAIEVRASRAAIGTWDRFRVQQIVSSLVENALKFGAAGAIEIGIASDDGFATFTVTDHGIGVARADQERIFERFERAVSVSEFGGLGLGLWIARRAAQALGGSIEVDSEPGRGATFTVRLPIGSRAAAA